MSKFKVSLLQGHQGDGIINTWKDLRTVRGWSLTFSLGIYTIRKGFKDCQDTMTWNHRLCWKAKPGLRNMSCRQVTRTLRLLELWYLIRACSASIWVSTLPTTRLLLLGKDGPLAINISGRTDNERKKEIKLKNNCQRRCFF